MQTLGQPSLRRAVLLVVALSSSGLAVGRVAVPRLAASPATFDQALVGLAIVALLLVLGWATAIALAVLLQAATGREALTRACPTRWRAAVLVLCGAALVAGTPPTYAADGTGRPQGGPAVDLPSLERPTDRLPAAVVVRTGDSLWRIEARRHPGARAAELARRTGELYADNRSVIGADPDLIRPGQRLRTNDHEGTSR